MSRRAGALGAVIVLSTLLGFNYAAKADLFVVGSNYTIQGTDPTTGASFSSSVTLTPGAQSIDGGALQLTTSIVSSGSGEWLVFSYSTTSGAPLSQQGNNWNMAEVGLNAAVPVNFTASFLDFSSNGVVQTPSSNIFGGFSIEANPVPGFTGTGFGASGFVAPFPDGALPSLGTFISPWSFLNSTGINSTSVNGYLEALFFEPQVAAVPEPTSLALLASSFVAFGLARRRR